MPKTKLLTFLICLCTVLTLHAQDNCFEKCWENAKMLNPQNYQTKEERTKGIEELMARRSTLLQNLNGCPAPDFTARTLQGDTLVLHDLKGKVVVINFWFIACAPCIAEMPALNRLVEDYKAKDVVFIAFGKDDAQSIKTFLEKKSFTYPIVSSDYDLSKKYCILTGWPMNMVLDKQGVVRQIFSGGRIDEAGKNFAYEKMKPVIEEWLGK